MHSEHGRYHVYILCSWHATGIDTFAPLKKKKKRLFFQLAETRHKYVTQRTRVYISYRNDPFIGIKLRIFSSIRRELMCTGVNTLTRNNKSVFPYMGKRDASYSRQKKYVYIPLIASHYLYWELISEFLRWHTKANGSVKSSKKTEVKIKISFVIQGCALAVAFDRLRFFRRTRSMLFWCM